MEPKQVYDLLELVQSFVQHYIRIRSRDCRTASKPPRNVCIKIKEEIKGHHAAVPKKRKGSGKPKFPEEVNEKPSLADLTGEDSGYFFWLRY